MRGLTGSSSGGVAWPGAPEIGGLFLEIFGHDDSSILCQKLVRNMCRGESAGANFAVGLVPFPMKCRYGVNLDEWINRGNFGSPAFHSVSDACCCSAQWYGPVMFCGSANIVGIPERCLFLIITHVGYGAVACPRKPSCGAGIASGPLYRECGSVAGPCVVAPPSSDQVLPPEGSDCTSPAAFSLLGSVWTVSMSSGGPSPVRACLSVKVPPGFISARRPRGIDYRCCRPCFAPGIQLFEMRRCSTCLMREVAEVHIGSS